MDPILRTQSLEAFYGDAQALFGIDFELFAEELVAIIGANGAGKSTFLKCLTGLIKVPQSAIHWKGQAMGGLPTGDIVKSGLTMVPEGRRLFPSLTVEENLMMGANAQRKGAWNLARIYKLFPILKEKRALPSTSLSGGQQQMIAIGRALMSNPDVLLCDELSLGLAPIVIKEIYSAMPEITSEGMTVVIVEQDVAMAKLVSKRLYCFQEGRVSLQGDSHSLTNQEISHAYFGV
jgi:branched-chain amino acid transport system ATP-binding protein